MSDDELMAMSDEDLMTRVARNDKAAFTVLYYRHDSSLRLYLSRFGQDLALDVAQAVWLKVWVNAHTFRGNFRAWLITIGSHEMIDELRRRGREPSVKQLPVDLEGLLDQTPDLRPTPDDIVQTAEIIAALRKCIEELPENSRLLCLLVYLEKITISAAAEMLGIPKGTAEGQTAKIKIRLRECLERKGFGLE